MSLPRDIYLHIGTFLPLSAQAKYHQVCKTFREFPIDLEQCCVPPSNLEIVTFLSSESKTINLVFYSTSCFRKYIILKAGKMIGRTRILNKNGNNPKVSEYELNTFDEVLSFLSDAKLILYFEPFFNTIENWLVTRQILSLRKTGMLKLPSYERITSMDVCYIRLLTCGSPIIEWDNSVDVLHYLYSLIELINSPTQKRFEKEFASTLKLPFDINISDPTEANYSIALAPVKIDTLHTTLWLKQWIAQLQPSDLA